MRRRSHGFTLVELLAVIAIMALLAALLLPAAARANATARSRQCLSNMRQIGLGLLDYALDHEGRFPGSASTASGSVSWHDILRLGNYVGLPVQRMGPTPIKGQLYCPSMKFFNNQFPRAYLLNGNALGGLVSASEPAGPYGLLANPAELGVGYTFLRYGAPVSRSVRPAFQILMAESERHTDELWFDPSRPAMPTLGDSPLFPAWSGQQGIWAFRHDLRANELFFDGHVENIGPTNQLNTAARLSFP